MVSQNTQERFELLYRQHARLVLAYALTRTTRENAHDATASTFLVAWRRFDHVPDDPLPWLIGVARRVLADQWRSDLRRSALRERLGGWPSRTARGSTTFPSRSSCRESSGTLWPGFVHRIVTWSF